MSDPSKIPTLAMTPRPQSRTAEFVEWDAPVDADTPVEVQVTVATSDDLPLTKKIVIIPSLPDVKVVVTLVGKDTQDEPERSETIEMPITNTPNEELTIPSETEKTPLTYLARLSIKVLSNSPTLRTLALKLHLESCIKTGLLLIRLESFTA